MSKSELALRLGWVRPDIKRLNRALGYRQDNPGRKTRQRTNYSLALAICTALNASPFECGV